MKALFFHGGLLLALFIVMAVPNVLMANEGAPVSSLDDAADNVVRVDFRDGTRAEYSTLQDAASAATDGSTITFLKDFEVDGDETSIVFEHSATFDLNGHTATFKGVSLSLAYNMNADFVITDNSAAKNGALVRVIDENESLNNNNLFVSVINLTIKAGNIGVISNQKNIVCYTLEMNYRGSLTVEGGYIYNKIESDASAAPAAIHITGYGGFSRPEMTMTGGNIYAEGTAFDLSGAVSLNIGGGRIEADNNIFRMISSFPSRLGSVAVGISGGEFVTSNKLVSDNSTTADKVTIDGGEFEGYKPEQSTHVTVNGKITEQTKNGEAWYAVLDDESNCISYTIEKNGTPVYIVNNVVDIHDGDSYSFDVPSSQDGQSKLISYTRDFTNTGMQAWFAPFTIEDQSAYADQVTFYEITGQLDDNGNPCCSTFDGAVEAGKPYFVKAKNTGEITFTATRIKETASSTTINADGGLTFSGVYATKEASEGDHNWYALRGGRFYKASAKAVLKPFRFYLAVSDNAKSPESFGLTIVDDAPTGIHRAGADKTQDRGETIYDLGGHKVAKPEKGVYIVNGKKVLYK